MANHPNRNRERARLADECHGYNLDGNPVRKIVTEFIYPPIPDRRWDWAAYRDGWEPGEPFGQGATEQAAIDDLLMEEDGLC